LSKVAPICCGFSTGRPRLGGCQPARNREANFSSSGHLSQSATQVSYYYGGFDTNLGDMELFLECGSRRKTEIMGEKERLGQTFQKITLGLI